MPILILSILVQVTLVVHVIKTGRNTIWIWVLVLLPLVGTIAYFIVELLPDLMGSRGARRAVRNVQRAIDPDRDLRRATTEASISDTVGNQARLAEELARSGDHAGAIEAYRAAMRGFYEHDPNLMLGLAQAQFGGGLAAEARATLDALIHHNPEFKSADGHLLYARALETEGNLVKAQSEYAAVAGYYPGAEAKVRYAQFLKQRGLHEQARRELEELLRTAEIVPKHARKAQAEWLAIAKRELGG